MGIPSYFTYIVKNYPAILKKFVASNKIDNFYLDSNSIIYEAYYKLILDKEPFSTDAIIRKVISKIESYIALVQPTHTIFIAFDGVAPVAKLQQQRSRRYKSSYLRKDQNQKEDAWNTAAITPGTKFMYDLTIALKKYFIQPGFYGVQRLIVSSSDVSGEGEHKLFEYMRMHAEEHADAVTVIYGLDADLIMLSLNHLHICPRTFLFREAPHFIQSVDADLEPCANYLLDIRMLGDAIVTFMKSRTTDAMNDDRRVVILDYLLLCFFLGNDFLPHFPALNIRTGGVDKMLAAYRAAGAGTLCYVSSGGKVGIHWSHLRQLVAFLAKQEQFFILQEYKTRNKYRVQSDQDPVETMPMRDRSVEHYINPSKDHWEDRYYTALLGIVSDSDGSRKRVISQNFLEGLEWTLQYYTNGCPDWRWKYNYEYPPLLVDLVEAIPLFDTQVLPVKQKRPVSALVQLCYVLPHSALHLLPRGIAGKLLEEHPEWYKDHCELLWAFCKYMWESHVLMEHIDVDELEKFIEKNRELIRVSV